MAAPSELARYPYFDLDIGSVGRVLKPRGEVDALTAPILLDAAQALIAASVGDVTIDLAEVTFASSALVNALINIRSDLARQGAGLWLVNESTCVQRLFLISGFTKF